MYELPLVPDAYDRTDARISTVRVVHREGKKYYVQGADLNEMDGVATRRGKRISDLISRDGDRVEGGDAVVDVAAQTVHCYAGRVYANGDVHPVADRVLTAVPMTGEVSVGIRLVYTMVDEMTDPTLLGLAPGTAAEGEPGAARIVASVVWSIPGDGLPGDFYQVYRLLDGTIISQVPPPALSGVIDQLADYDSDSNGNYIVDGCLVTPLGKTGTSQVFSIGSGTANINGYKRTRETAFRFIEPEEPDLELIAGESHIFTGTTGGTTTVAVNRAPYSDVVLTTIVKRVTENRVRGATPGGFDDLTYASAFQIELIDQSGTIVNTAYSLVDGKVSWGNAGPEPLAGSTYAVTYLYNAVVVPTNQNGISMDVTGGVNGQSITITYHSKMPRIDVMCLDISGRPIYRRGISARVGALPPQIPSTLLKLAEIYNDWMNVPVVANNGTPNLPKDELYRYIKLIVNIADQFSRSVAENNLQSSTLVAKGKIFTDTFVSDYYRDQGAAQTAAVNQGVLQLAVDNALMQPIINPAATLTYTEEVVVAQTQRTSSQLINMYDNFTPMPAGMRVEPPADFWTDQVTTWTSPVTQEFSAAPDRPPGETVFNEVASAVKTSAEFLRQLTIHITLEGFGVGENLATLTLDGVSVKPAGTQTADADGQIEVDVVIPPNIPSGKRLLRATGAADSFAQAIYVGEGIIDVITMRRVTLVTRAAPVPITIVNNTINVINNITNQVTSNFGGISGGGHDEDPPDPLAQAFRVPDHRLITGVNFWITAIGNRANGIRVQLATMSNGFPTKNVLAEAFISMATPVVGQKLMARFELPVYLSPLEEFCFVIMTADSDHAVAISRLGDVIDLGGGEQGRVASNPYTVGEMFTSSNRSTWTAHGDADIAFELIGAVFTPGTRVVNLWTGAITNISDIMVRGAVELPTDEADFRYEIVRADSSVIKLLPGQNHEFTEFVTETITLRAVLKGTALVSPILYPNTLLVGGRMRTTGTYITRATPLGSGVTVYALFAAKLPGTSTVAVAVDDALGGAFAALTLDTTGILGGGWTEPKYKKTAYSAVQGRVRLTLTGTPAERPLISGALRVYPV